MADTLAPHKSSALFQMKSTSDAAEPVNSAISRSNLSMHETTYQDYEAVNQIMHKTDCWLQQSKQNVESNTNYGNFAYKSYFILVISVATRT